MTYEIVESVSEPSTFQGTYCLTVLVVQNKGLGSPYLACHNCQNFSKAVS